MFRRWLWQKLISKRLFWNRPKQSLQLESLEERFLLNADSPALNAQSLYQSLPLSFEANEGQLAPQVQFSSSGSGYTLFLTSASAYLSLQKDTATGASDPALVQMQLVGANADAKGAGLNLQDSTSNYLIGSDPSQWHQGVANFGSVKFSNVYQGVDLIYYGNQRQLEYDFVVAPGANPNSIALAFPGTPSLSLDANGDLLVHTTGGDLVEHAPVLYQMNGAQKVAVSGSYVIGADNTVHFQVGAYDHALPLVIDPVMSYATYLGGSGADNSQAVAVDAAGNVYITGFTGSSNFPTQSALQGQLGGQGNVFVAKINPAGNGLVYSTYVGGGGFDLGLALRVDIAGNAYVAGTTTSGNFPVKNAIQGTFGGGSDAFVFKLNSSGNGLVFSTYLGGAGVEFAQGLALDASSNIYVVGFTYSTNFPTVNALQPTAGGGQDAWVAKIASSGTSLIFSTYLGGAQDDSAQSVGIDASGNVYVAGDTYSANFPTKNPLRSYGGGDDAFVAKLNANGSALLFSTFLGGSGDDRASAIRLDASGNVYVVGSTSSTNFPTVNALQSKFGGNTDAFVTKLSSDGSSIGFSTYLGGSDVDQAMALAVDSSNNIYVVGFTASTDFPIVNGAQTTLGGGDGDAFLVKLPGTGSSITYSTYFGGADDDRAMGVAIDGLGNIYIAGTTASGNFPTVNALQSGFGGSFDGFIIKMSQAPATQLAVTAPTTTAGNTFALTVAALDAQGNPAGDYTGTIHFTSTDPSAILPPDYTFKASDNGVHTFTGVQFRTAGNQSITAIDTVKNSIVGTSGSIAVAAMINSFALSGFPASSTAGTPNSITVTARDVNGNVATGYTGAIHFTTTDPRGVLPSDYQFTPADHGVHTFTNVVLKTAGTQSITATDTTLGSVKGTQSGITIVASSTSLAMHLSIVMPLQVNSGSPVSVTITALDLTNAVADDYRGTIHFTSSDGTATLPADYTFTAADKGTHTFRATFQSVQPLTLTVTDAAKATINASLGNIHVNPPVGKLTLSSTVSSTPAGSVVTFTITAQDILQGLASGYQGTVHFTSNDALAGLPADYTFTAADSGSHTFQATFNTGGLRFVTATDTTTSTLKGSVSFSVISTPVGVVLGGLGQTAPAGTPQNVTVTIVDASGNAVPSYAGTVHFTSTDGQAVLPADYTFTAADQGVHTFQVTFKTPGGRSLTVADAAAAALKTTVNVTVTANGQVVVLGGLAASVTAGAAQTVTVTLTDSFGNVATGYTGTLHFASSDSQAVLPADYTFTAADQGKHTFQVTFKTAGTQSFSVTDTGNSAVTSSMNVSVAVAAQNLAISDLAAASTAGAAQSVTVTLADSLGNVATAYVGTVHFTSTDAKAVLPADYTFTAADQGKHTFQVTFKTTGTQTLTATDTAKSALTASANSTITTSAQVLSFSGFGQAATAGATQSVTITLTDNFGNVATGYTGTVHFTSSDSQATLPPDYTFTSADQGKHTFQYIYKTAGAQSLTATDTANSALKATGNTSVTTTAQTLGLTGLGQSVTAGAAQSVTITLTDNLGNVATGYTGTVHFTCTDGQAVLPADYTFTAADQGKHTFQVTFKTAGAQSISATDAANSALKATSNVSVTTSGQIMVLGGLGQSATAGTPQTLSVTLTDTFGNVLTNYLGTVHFTSSDARAGLPSDYTFTAADQGTHSFQVTFKTTRSQSVSVTDTANAAVNASASLNVTTTAQVLALTGLAQTATAGGVQSVTITLTDNFGNVATGYTGTVHFTSTDGQALLPADYTFTAADQGKHTFQVTFKTAGAQSLSAADAANNALKATGNVSVTTSGQIMVLSGLGQSAPAGALQTLSVTLTDTFGNVLTSYLGTVHFTSTDSQAGLPPDYTFTAADQGKHNFQVTFKTTGSQSVSVTDTANAAVKASASLNITTTAQVLALTGLGQNVTAGTAQSVTITLTDNFGNVATGYVGTVHFTSTDGQATLPADYTFTAADQGKHTFQISFATPGAQSLQVSDTASSSLQASANITVTVASQLLVLIGLGQSAKAGDVQNVTVKITDSLGHVASGYVGTVHFTSSDARAALPADYTFTAADQGTHNFQVTFKTTGSQTLTAVDSANNSLNSSATVSISTTAQLMTLTGLGQTAVAGAAQNVTVTLTDNFGNVAAGYTGAVHFASSDGQAILPADYTFTAADLGKHTFQVTFHTTGTQSLTISDAANSALTASANVSVTTSAQVLSLGGLGQNAVAGVPQTVTIALHDNLGNVATGYVGTVHFTTSDGQAVLPADYTFTAADRGQHTFSVTFKTTGTQSLSATDTTNGLLTTGANVSVTTSAQVLAISGLGRTTAAGAAQSITVTMTDSFGNAATSYVGTVHFTSSDSKAGLPADYTFTAADQGKHTFQVSFKTTGTQSVGVGDTGNTGLSASASTLVNTTAQLVTLTGLSQSVSAGAVQNVTVTMTDSFGNVATGYTGTVHFTSSDGKAVLPADYTFTAADQGSHTFQVTLKTTGSQSISATDTVNAGLKASANTIVTTTAQIVTLSGLGQNAVAGASQTITVTLVDNFGNVATGYVGAMHFTTSDGQAIVPADYTFTGADQGSHTFQVTFKTAGSQSITVADPANSALKATANVNVQSSTQVLNLSGLAQTSVAGMAQNVTVTVVDQFGYVIKGYVGSVRFTSSDSKAVLPADYTFSAADQGTHTFQATFKTTGSQTLSVTDTANSNLKASASVTVTTSAQVLAITGLGQTATAGAAKSVTITVQDNFGNVITNYLGTIHFTSSDPNAVLLADYAFTSADQGTHTFQATFETAGTQTLNAVDTANSNLKVSASVSVTASAQILKIAGLGQTATAGAVQNVTITVTDSFGNVVPNYQGTIHFTSSDSKAILPADYTFSLADQGTHTFQVRFKTAGAQSLSIADTVGGGLKGNASVTVTTSAQLVVLSGLGQSATAGSPQSVTITVTDTFGNVITGYVGTIHFTSSDVKAALPADYTFTAADHGTHTFQATFKTAGTQSITAADTANSGLKATASLSITTSAQVLAVGGLGQTATAGSPQNVTITATDTFGNLVTSYVGTVHFTSSDNKAVLPGDYTFTAADQGTHTFQATFKTTGKQSIGVADKSNVNLKGSGSAAVTTSAKVLSITGLSQTVTAGTAQNVTVTLTDNFGNVVTNYLGTVDFTSSDSRADLSADYTFTAADQGTHPFSVTFKTAGAQSLSIADAVDHSLKATANVAVTASAQMLVLGGLGQSANAGVPQNVTVTLTDTYGNVISNYLGTVHFSSSDTKAGLPADYTFAAADQGKHTFQATFKTAGLQSITVTDAANGTLKASASTTVTTSAQAIAITGLGQSATAGTPQSVTVTVTDNYGNVISNYAGTLHFTSSDAKAVLPADYSFKAADLGTHTFQIALKTAGAQTITATDTANSSLKATASSTITSSAQVLVLTERSQTATAGTSQNVTVTLMDNFGNVITNYAGTIHFTSSDNKAALPADYIFTTADKGTHNFTVTLKTAGTQSFSATDKSNSALTASASILVTTSAQVLVLASPGQDAIAGTAQNITITLTDDFGNVATNYLGVIHFTSSDSKAVLAADYTFTAADKGTHTFQVTFKTAGTQSITAADNAKGALKATGNVTVTTAAQSAVLSGLAPSANTGASQSVTVTITDNLGNIVTNYAGTLHFTSSDSKAVLPADYTFTAADQGKHTFQFAFKTPGSQSLNVADAANASLTAADTVSVVAAAQLVVLGGIGQSVTAGTQQSVTVTLTDTFGNIATSYAGTLHFASSDSQAGLPADYTFTAADQGKHTFSVTLKTAGTQSLSVTDTNQSSLTAVLSGITVAPVQAGNAVRLQITGPSSVVAGQAASYTITALDAQGHVATGYTGAIFWISSDPLATGARGFSFSAADQGKHTFSLTFNTTGTQSLSAFDQQNASLVGSLGGITVSQPTNNSGTISALAPTQVSVGALTAVTVFVLDAQGQPVTNYHGTLHFQSSDPNATLPPDYKFTDQDQGSHIFTFRLQTAGQQTLTISDTANPLGLTAKLTIMVAEAGRAWTGQGSNNLWSNPQNWDGGIVPTSGDTVVFTGSSAQTGSTFDLPSGVLLKSIVLLGSNFKIAGAALSVKDSIDASKATGTNTIQASLNLAGKVEVLAGNSQLNFAAPINLNANTLTVDAGAGKVTVTSTLSGSSGLILAGGTLTLAGTGSNSLTGTIRVDAGTLQLAQTGGVAVAGRLIVGSTQGDAGSAKVVLLGANQIDDAAKVSVNATGLLNLAGQSNSFGALTLAGGEVETGSGILTLDGDLSATAGTSLLGGNVKLVGSRVFTVATGTLVNVTAAVGGSGGITKAGAGTLTLAGTNSYNAATTVTAGTLIVNGTMSSSQIVVRSGAVVGGTGMLASLSIQGGSYQPGSTAGPLGVQGNASFASGSLFTVNLTAAGNNELVSAGQIILTGSILKLSLGYQPTSGTKFTIASAAQGIVGTFAGLPEGSLVTINNVPLRISYKGGPSGHEVVLTVV
jgi:autotransporter-associated beta strand protein